MVGLTISVRGAFHTYLLTKNTKIPKTVFYKLQFHTSRVQFECLDTLPFNFKILGGFAELSAPFSHYSVSCLQFLICHSSQLRKSTISVVETG